MELRQLAYFEAVIRHGSFTRAAQSLDVAQPAVSAQIRRLEAELGVTLLARTTRRVSLTSAGELFLARARRVLGELDAARDELDELTTVRRGRVRLGATGVLGTFDLPAALASFSLCHPGVGLTLRSGLIAHLLAALDAHDVDLVLGPIHADLPSRYDAAPLIHEDLVLVTAPAHRLADQPRLRLAELADEPFVCLPPESGLHAILTAAAGTDGFEPRIQFETSTAASVRELVSAGLGVALLARSAAQGPGPSVSVHAVHPAPPHPPVGLIHHLDHRLTPAAEACRRHLARAATSIA